MPVPGGLPTYPQRGTTIMSGEPFVTPGPCEFDARFMLDASNCMPVSSPCGDAVPLTASPVPVAPVLPGTIAPPTIMPGQVPGLYSQNNAGWRPCSDSVKTTTTCN